MNDVAVVGAGPAGIAASIYLKRAGLMPLLFERAKVGGLIMNANLIENYPGFPGGIRGRALAALFKRQLADVGVRARMTEVTRISVRKNGFYLVTSIGNFPSRCVILATGTIPKEIELDGLKRLVGKRLFYEVKDIPYPRRGRRVVIIGGGDAAFDYALNLSSDGCEVCVLMRGREPSCIPVLGERAVRASDIHIVRSASPKSVREEDHSLALDYLSSGVAGSIVADYVLIACGRVPDLGMLPDRLSGMIESGKYTIPGLFIAGDVRRGDFRQVGIAVGDGILAAMSAVSFLGKGGTAW